MERTIIAERIKELRRKQNLTQEELGDMVGVSAGAISKWERAVTAPDIMLLAPVARALHTTIDELLCFSNDLDQHKIQEYKEALIPIFLQEGFTAGEERCEALLLEYPNSCALKLMAAGLYHMYFMTLEGAGPDVVKQKQERILTLLKEVIHSQDATLIPSARYLYADITLEMERYEACEAVLKDMSENFIDPFPMQEMLYMKQQRYEECAQASSGRLLYYMSKANACISFLCQIAEQKDEEALQLLCFKASHQLYELFHIGFDSSLYDMCRFYYQRKEDQTAATYFLSYVDSVLQAPYDYDDHPFFSMLKLDIKPDMQKLIRKKLLEELYKDSIFQRCIGIPAYDQAMDKIKAYLI